MSRTVVILVSVALGLLCLAALDDITTGSEPGYLLEWIVVAATAVWLGGLAAWRWRPEA
jgi:hypothetical protein